MPGRREVLRNVAIGLAAYSMADPPVLGTFFFVPNINEVIINRNYEDNSGYVFGEAGMVHDPGLENSDVSLTWLANDYSTTDGVEQAVQAVLPRAAQAARTGTPAVPARTAQSGKARLIVAKSPTLGSNGMPTVSVASDTAGSAMVGAMPNWAMDISVNAWVPISGSAGGYATLSVGWMVDGVVDPHYATVAT